MSSTALIWIHVQTGLLLLALGSRLWRLERLPTLARLCVSLILLHTGLLPLGPGLNLTAYVLPYSGQLSLTSLLLLTAISVQRLTGCALFSGLEWRGLLCIVAGAGTVLYPAALGLGTYDPYRWGFSIPGLALGIGSMALLAWQQRRHSIAWWLLAVWWAWLLHLGLSPNLWDYWIDPWLFLYALGVGMLWGFNWGRGCCKIVPLLPLRHVITSRQPPRNASMLGEQHNIDHEFPEYHQTIAALAARDPTFAALMQRHDALDNEIRELELHNQPVSDVFIEEQKKQRALLKDRIYDWLRHS